MHDKLTTLMTYQYRNSLSTILIILNAESTKKKMMCSFENVIRFYKP